MATILITGGTGLVGKALTNILLAKGYTIIVMGRRARENNGTSGLTYAKWDIEKQEIDSSAIAQADYIIHLAGAGVAEKRWTGKRKKEILDSRVRSGELLVKSLQKIPNKVKALISASAIGWYGADQLSDKPVIKPFTETDNPAEDFLGQTCKSWEESTAPVSRQGIRLVYLRIGIVLSREGGAFKEFLKPLRFGVATILGSGKQIISWIHINDLVNIFAMAIENEKFNGIYNAVAPAPVSNKTLILAMAKARNKFYLPLSVPGFLLKLMLGEMSVEILKSATVSAGKLLHSGYNYQYKDIHSAMKGFF
jgi:hypothetical protein